MSLGTRLTLKTAVLVMAVVVVAGVALWGLGGLNRDLDSALEEYDRLRASYSIANGLGISLSLVRDSPIQAERLNQSLLRVLLLTDELEGKTDPEKIERIRESIEFVIIRLDEGDFDENSLVVLRSPIYTAQSYISSEIDDTTRRIEEIDNAAQDHRTRVTFWITLTAVVTAGIAIVIGIWQYLAVMRPLNRLQRGVKRLALGDFADRLRVSGDREFVQLANDFNRMADELAALYEDLEEKVRLRSAQLAQSERLASVGFLAAGVAHEINNPLAIIAGEAELALAALPPNADADLRQALTTTRDEAFRCKGITQKLLSLARPGSGERVSTDLNEIARSVSDIVRTLPQYEHRRIDIQTDPDAWSMTDPAQVKQVLLNLVINALEAVEPDKGRVLIKIDRSISYASIMVEDNGKGIAAEALPRIFEPFYTEKKTPTTSGLGLGLSISHAIIEDLGGKLTAASDGLGKGSLFIIELVGSDPGKKD